ncbi:MAG: polyprenol monophosphomannose synthase [Sandaracinus sp.]|nr:polyprenol monophosphomannose synthase [Myxococcales bacterium]MCB9599326.1 polyprenol monophosphomannose synthase [Sandaracinus sp.]MCB9613912.1 polyprenol monophosphomannose synthase [Sandaracinus sp.]MCB9625332.1 polyprenol monophosphomannose synthase [Sandaracinus sp.]MCB9634148.1 polyprenol monophosphomannose synthase [Sandaracinus sp.]
MNPKVLIVTPTYNERENLAPFLDGVFEVLPEAHALVVDDASPDGTGALAEQIAKVDRRVAVMHRPGKLGLGSAYLDAFRRGISDGYDLIFEMDTDLSHDPRYLPDFLEAFASGADVVIGSRNVPGGGVEGWGLGRHVLSKGGSLYSRTVLGLGVRDLTSGYKGFRRQVLEAIDLEGVRSEGYSFQVELTYRAIRRGFRVAEVPIVFVDRRAGQSKMSRKIFAEAVMMMPKLRLDAMLGKL